MVHGAAFATDVGIAGSSASGYLIGMIPEAGEYDPEEPGRGPGRIGGAYVVFIPDGDFLGTWIGYVQGVTKGADTLVFRDRELWIRNIEYRDLRGAIRYDPWEESLLDDVR